MRDLEKADKHVRSYQWFRPEDLEGYEIFHYDEIRDVYLKNEKYDVIARMFNHLLRTLSEDPLLYNNLVGMRVIPYHYREHKSWMEKEEVFVGFAFYKKIPSWSPRTTKVKEPNSGRGIRG